MTDTISDETTPPEYSDQWTHGGVEAIKTALSQPVISDEARTLVAAVLKASLYENISKGSNPALVAQSALNAARNKALEDAANACEERFMKLARGDYLLPDAEPQLNDCVELADAIRAMKVQP